MLRPNEFFVGSVADAKPLSCVLPRGRPSDFPVLVCGENDKPNALALAGNSQYRGFSASELKTRVGIVVPNIVVEIDEMSCFHPVYVEPPVGALLRTANRLDVCAKGEGHWHDTIRMLVLGSLLDSGAEEAGFTRWSIVIDEGVDKRTLFSIDVSEPPA